MAEGGVKDRAGDALTRVKRRIGVENPSAADDDGNVGIVRGALRAFGEGEIDQFLDTLKTDVTWEAPGGNFPGDEALDGRDAVKEQFVGDAHRTFTEFGFVPEKFLDASDENAVVVLGTFSGDSRQGDSINEPAVQVWQFEGSEAEHVRIYVDSAAFPEVVTEEKEQEWEQEEKEQEEQEESKAEDESDDAEGEDDSEDDDSEAEGKSDSEAESKSDTDAESKSDSGSEGKSDDSDGKDDSDSEGKDDSDSDDSEGKSGS